MSKEKENGIILEQGDLGNFFEFSSADNNVFEDKVVKKSEEDKKKKEK